MSKRLLTIAGVFFFLAVVFCAGFIFFYNRMQRTKAEAAATATSTAAPDPSKSLIDKPFPKAQLVDIRGAKVDEQVLRTGRVIVVFVTPDCDACTTESKFLQTLVGRREDVTFYGLVPFGGRPGDVDEVEDVEKKFPFKVLYDEENSFVMSMGINRVPVKVFLENGIIKKGWIGAAQTDKAKSSFTEWFDGLQ
jgi:peroxiredoxin